MRHLFALPLLSGLALAQTVIPFWHTVDPPGQAVLESLVAEFNAKQKDYRLESRYVGDLREGGIKLLAALRSGGAPALYYAEVSFAARGVKEGLAVPLDSYLGSLPDDFYPTLLEAGRYGGKTYALPVELHVPVLFYNADQFAARGISVPKTWDDVASAAQKLTTRAAKGYIVSSDIYSFNALVMSRGGSLIGPDGKPNFTDSKVLSSLQYLQSLVQKGWAQSRNIAEAQFSAADFVRTKAFMVIAPVTQWPVLEARVPIPFKLGVAALPKTPDGKVPLAGGTLMVLRGANEAQAKGAVAFWKFLMEPVSIARYVQATYALPMRKAAQPLLADFYKADPRRQVAPSQLDNAVRWISDPEATVWYDALEQALEKALKGGMDARAALEEAQKKALTVEK
jgi:sn-glycerol 3-phosphate transport system substrate-binding protein